MKPKSNWDEATLYQHSKFFGIGMSGWQPYDWWHHKEDTDIEWYEKSGPVGQNLYLLETITLWW